MRLPRGCRSSSMHFISVHTPFVTFPLERNYPPKFEVIFCVRGVFAPRPGQQAIPNAIKLIPAMRLITTPAPAISAANNTRGRVNQQDEACTRLAQCGESQKLFHLA